MGNDFGFPSPATGNLSSWERGLEITGAPTPAVLCIFGVEGRVRKWAGGEGSLSHDTHYGVSWPLHLAALSSYNPVAAGPTGWLNYSAVSGTWARMGHATPNNVPCGVEEQEGLRLIRLCLCPGGAYGDASKKWVEQTSKAEDTLDYSKCMGRRRAGSVWEESLIRSFGSWGISAMGQALPSYWGTGILSFMYKMVKSKNGPKRGPDPSRSLKWLKGARGGQQPVGMHRQGSSWEHGAKRPRDPCSTVAIWTLPIYVHSGPLSSEPSTHT